MFMPNTTADMSHETLRGSRIDGRNLFNEWHEKMSRTGKRFKFVYNASDFRNTNFKEYDHILGSFIFLKFLYKKNPI